jgi:hypothetical protein
MILPFFAFLGSMQLAGDDIETANEKAYDAHFACVVQRAKRFEASGEPAEPIADAAVGGCLETLAAIRHIWIQKAASERIGGDLASELWVSKLQPGIDDSAHGLALEAVMKIRAQRNTARRLRPRVKK